MIPSFAGRSYIQLRRLQHGFRELWIEMTFRSLEPDGVLLYTGQSADGVGDFVAPVNSAWPSLTEWETSWHPSTQPGHP